LEESAAGWWAGRTATAATAARVFGPTTTTWIEWWLRRRFATETVIAWAVVIVIVRRIVAVVVFLIPPVKHALALFEVIGDVIYTFLSGFEAMSAKSASTREFGFGDHYTGIVEVFRVHLGVDVSEMLDKVVLSITWLDILDPLNRTQAANPGFTWVAFLFIALPVVLAAIPFAALPGALVNFPRIPTKQLKVFGRAAPLLATPRGDYWYGDGGVVTSGRRAGRRRLPKRWLCNASVDIVCSWKLCLVCVVIPKGFMLLLLLFLLDECCLGLVG